MIRYVDGWQLHAYVDRAADGPEEMIISARHLAQDAVRVHTFGPAEFPTMTEATNFIEGQLAAVTGVGCDGSLRF